MKNICFEFSRMRKTDFWKNITMLKNNQNKYLVARILAACKLFVRVNLNANLARHQYLLHDRTGSIFHESTWIDVFHDVTRLVTNVTFGSVTYLQLQNCNIWWHMVTCWLWHLLPLPSRYIVNSCVHNWPERATEGINRWFRPQVVVKV